VRVFGHRFRLGLSVAPPLAMGVPHEPCRQRDLLCPLLTSALRSDCLSTISVASATRSRSPEVSSAAFCAQSPNLRFASLLEMDFAVSRPLVRRSRLVSGSCPSTRTFDPCFFQTPPRGGSPCILASPSPPSGWAGTFTRKLLNMLSTPRSRWRGGRPCLVVGSSHSDTVGGHREEFL
jgi:hypothetical protein